MPLQYGAHCGGEATWPAAAEGQGEDMERHSEQPHVDGTGLISARDPPLHN